MLRRSLIASVLAGLMLASPAAASPRPSLEQLAYHYWGAPLAAACPNHSLHFVLAAQSPRPAGDAQGGSWGDCQPWVNTAGRTLPEICDTAIHEAGHERGLLDVPGAGGIMDNTRLTVGSRGWVTRGHRRVFQQFWNVVSVCQPGYRIPSR